MWVFPLKLLQELIENARRDVLVDGLNRMSDHLLQDVGLRRDQLDLLRRRPTSPPRDMTRSGSRGLTRPILRGCG